MSISQNFVPSNFEILDFYGDEMCFAWCDNRLVVFPYVKSIVTGKLPTHVAPRDIRSLRCFNGRVFVLCEPTGIYKILRTYKFSPLSSAGIANGPAFYEVFITENNWLHSQNKSTKVDRQLFKLETMSSGAFELHDMTLNDKNSELRLRRAIHPLDDKCDQDVCIVANVTRVFAITRYNARIVYRCEQEIIDVVGILRGKSIAGIVLVTRAGAVLVYVVEEKLIFDKVYFENDVKGLCAGMANESDDTIWLAHIDETSINYWAKSIKDNTFRKTNTHLARFVAIKNYKSKLLICLTDEGKFVEFSIESLGLGRDESDGFIVVRSEMLRGTDRIVDLICERAKELQIWNERLLAEQEILRRINIYSHEEKIIYLPEIRVDRAVGRLYARIKFVAVLPLNCHVIVGVVSNKCMINCVKFIDDSVMTMDLSLENLRIDDKATIRTDLVTLAEESRAWCLVRNYTRNPRVVADSQISSDRRKFLKAKLAALRNLTDECDVTAKELCIFKKNFRKELKNL